MNQATVCASNLPLCDAFASARCSCCSWRAVRAEPLGAVPAPESVFGFTAGADYKLATYDQSIEYFRKLAAASRYIKLVEAGKTSQGRTMYFALISSPKNLANLDRHREIWQRLAHPQGLTDAEAQRLAAEGVALVHIDGGLHATEVAGPQHTPLLAYDLLAGRTSRRPRRCSTTSS